ncbi:MAG: hypothetical protein LQ343_006022 [Gyalolechia ehrenbergii]|nr:MAG: hypothetical protein LQ343_006022 [Gyalolechia ehrenbergii]
MTTTSATSTFSGDNNSGLQLGSNAGQVHVHFNSQPEIPQRQPKPSSTVPFRRDPDFVDRDILTQIEQKCSKPASRTALVGLGGVGKSQLAIEYSYQVRNRDPSIWIFWIYGGSAARFEEGYRMIADRVKIPRRDEPGADAVRLVSIWLNDEFNGRWIMILDNVGDPAVLARPYQRRPTTDAGNPTLEAAPLSSLIPQTQNGSILITSRNRDAAYRLTGSHQDIIEVEPMDESRALELLQKRIESEVNDGDAVQLVQALDYMPLAISQAGAYINHRAPRITISSYLDAYHKSDHDQATLLNRDAGDIRRDHSANNSIITTWQISFEHIREQRPSAARLLSLMSLFDRQGIPEWVLRHYDKENRGEAADVADMDFEDDISALTNYSLIRITNLEGTLFEMHRLVQFSTQRWLGSSEDLESWQAKYVRTISAVFPNAKYETWTTCRALFPHAKVVLEYQPADSQDLLHWTDLLAKVGLYARQIGNHLTAEEMSRRAVEEKERALGEGSPETLRSVHGLAEALFWQGRYEAAAEMVWRAVEGREKALGEEHPETLSSVNALALVLLRQRRYEAAEEMSRRAVEGREKALGPEHEDTLASLDRLALILCRQKKYEVAEMMCRRAIEGKEKSLGKEHRDTLASVDTLALISGDQQKRYKDAEALYQSAIEGCEKTLGKEHPQTLTSIHKLASIYQDQKQYKDAEVLYQRVIEGCEKTLGKEHPQTLISIHDLASIYQDQKQYKDAEALYQRVIEWWEKTLGKDFPGTLTSVYCLAYLYYKQKRYEDSEALYQRVIEGREKTLGKEHPLTLRYVYQLANLYYLQRRYKDAELLYQRAIDEREKTLGKEHPQILKSVYRLATLYSQQERYKDAEPLYQRAINEREKTLGKEHPQILKSVYRLATLYYQQERYKDAEPLYQRACAGFQAALGPDDQWTMKCLEEYSSMLKESMATATPKVEQSWVKEKSGDSTTIGANAPPHPLPSSERPKASPQQQAPPASPRSQKPNTETLESNSKASNPSPQNQRRYKKRRRF